MLYENLRRAFFLLGKLNIKSQKFIWKLKHRKELIGHSPQFFMSKMKLAREVFWKKLFTQVLNF